MSAKVRDMTSGSPGKLIMVFAFPLMLGNICQQLYTMVDTMVVGQLVGVQALAALGAVEWIMWLVLGIAQGMTQGFSILIAQYYGAKDGKMLKKAVAHSYMLTAVLSLVVLAVSQAGAHWILTFLKTPSDIIGMSLGYLRIVFCGIPVIAAYNMFASALRAMGNSRSPLIAMIIAAAINVVLDIVFVGGFSWGVEGAAAATVIAQTFSAVYCFRALGKIDVLKLEREDFGHFSGINGKLLKLGTPIVFQNAVIGVGGLVVQYVVNGYGFLFVAGFTATNKLYGILEMAAISYGYAIVTYVGQNYGANKPDRIRKGVKASAVIAFLTSVVISLIMILWGKKILALFISGSPKQTEQVLAVAYKYLFTMACFLWVLYFMYVYRSALQGLGDTLIPMLGGIAEFVMRIGVALFLPILMGQNGIFYAEIAAWTGAAVIVSFSYFRKMKKMEKARTYENTTQAME